MKWPVPAPGIMLFNEGTNAILTMDLTYEMAHTGLKITVPMGFVTDFASVPRPFWSALSPIGKHGRAAIIHDYLYWQQECTREQADRIMWLAMTESGVGSFDRWVIYQGLRRFGLHAWLANIEQRNAGLPRRVPVGLAVGSLDEWASYRQQLVRRGVRPDPKAAEPPAYCAAAMTVQISR